MGLLWTRNFPLINGTMANSPIASRAHLIVAFCLPLAVLLGYMLANPVDSGTLILIVMIIGVLSIPLLMTGYHPLLILTWNAAVTPFFIPGQPFIWMLIALVGLGFAVVNRLTSPEARFIQVPSVNRALIFFSAVVAATALVRGGLGLRSMGSSQYGGRGYYYVLGAIAGYFALISKRIPSKKAGLFIGIFFISALTALVPNVAYLGGPRLNFLFYLFPPVYAYEQALGDFDPSRSFYRIYGLTFGANGLYCFLLARYGLRGIFDIGKPLRLVLFTAAVLGSVFCGFRSFMLLFLLTVLTQFFAEKLYKPRVLLPVFAMLLLVCGVAFTQTDKLPLVVQRTVSFIPDGVLPVAVNPAIRAEVSNSTDWRVRMWKDVVAELPKYLAVGKGYALDPGELALAMEADRRNWTTYAWAIVTGTYHNGALTLLMPFGLGGGLAFVWFAIVSIKYLYRRSRYGVPELKTANTFLLAYFVARLIFYFGVFGSFYNDFFVFTGIIGLSISLNGPEVRTAEEPVTEIAEDELTPVAQAR